MSRVAERWKVEAVLCLLRAVELEGFFIAGSERLDTKTSRFMEALGFRRVDVFHEVAALEMRNYSEGPLADDKGRPHDLWVFGKHIESYQAYIKFAVFMKEDGIRCLCVSFHEAERPMRFPYGEGGC